jgi:hypothetical protein
VGSPVVPGEPSPFAESQIVEWLVDECRDVASRITAVTTSGGRIFATGSTVISRRTGPPLMAWQTHIQEGGRSHRQVKTLLLTAGAAARLGAG